jgi:hypothetical protein
MCDNGNWRANMESNSSFPLAETVLRANAGVLDLMSFTFPTNDPEEKKLRSFCVYAESRRILQGRLSPAETVMWTLLERNADRAIDPKDEARLYDMFDNVLIELAVTLGWRMYENTVVLARIAVWTDRGDGGVEKLVRFNAAINRHAALRRGKAQLPFTEPEWYPTRKAALSEVKALGRELQAQLDTRKLNRPPSLSALYEAIRANITGKPRSYGYLMANLSSFMNYLECEDSPSDTVTPLTLRFVTRQVTHTFVVDGWFDYQGCTASGKSRQIISRIGSQKRR